jgi:hypothetical protein
MTLHIGVIRYDTTTYSYYQENKFIFQEILKNPDLPFGHAKFMKEEETIPSGKISITNRRPR